MLGLMKNGKSWKRKNCVELRECKLSVAVWVNSMACCFRLLSLSFFGVCSFPLGIGRVSLTWRWEYLNILRIFEISTTSYRCYLIKYFPFVTFIDSMIQFWVLIWGYQRYYITSWNKILCFIMYSMLIGYKLCIIRRK